MFRTAFRFAVVCTALQACLWSADSAPANTAVPLTAEEAASVRAFLSATKLEEENIKKLIVAMESDKKIKDDMMKAVRLSQETNRENSETNAKIEAIRKQIADAKQMVDKAAAEDANDKKAPADKAKPTDDKKAPADKAKTSDETLPPAK